MTTTTIRRGRRLGGRTRKAFVLLHVVCGAAWFGIDLALGICVVTSLVAGDPRTAGTAVQAVELFAIWPMFAASLLCLGSGVVLGLGGKYGLVRLWWVAVKLALNVLMSTLIVVSLRPGIAEAASIGERLMAGDTTESVPAGLLFPVVVAPSMLLTAYLLSVFKPWGRIRRRPPGAPGSGERGRYAAGTPSGTAMMTMASEWSGSKGEPAVANADVGAIAGQSGAVDDGSVSDDEVIGHRNLPSLGP